MMFVCTVCTIASIQNNDNKYVTMFHFSLGHFQPLLFNHGIFYTS